METLLLFLSIIFVSLAHIVRVYRWSLFISVYELPKTKNLFRSLALGYLLNLILPFKLGDVARSYISGRKMKSGKSLGFSTVIIDRYFDILVVGGIFAVLIFAGSFGAENLQSLNFYIFLAIGLLCLSFLCFVFKSLLKKSLKIFSSIFNPNLEIKILKFSWALIQNFKDIARRISKSRLILSTLLMWGLYLAAYFFFAGFLNKVGMDFSWKDMFITLFAKNSIQSGGYELAFFFKDSSIYYLSYVLSQFVVLFAFSFMKIPTKKTDLRTSECKINLLPHTNQDERLKFLEMYFSDKYKDYIKNYLRINQNILIVRDYSAGSNATTMLCVNDGGQFFRKYAFGSDGEKLYEQVLWIERFMDVLPLPKIIRQEKQGDFCYYDMPFESNAVSLFNYAHSMPIENTWKIIEGAFSALESSVYKTDTRKSDKTTIEKYVDSKVLKNIEKIMNAKYLKPLMKFDEILINGRVYKNLPYYLNMLGKENLLEIFKTDEYSAVHGDLTIENIICTRSSNGDDGFYIIDPNTGNIHDSPALDYGKLLQSIGGGYEFLMMTQNVEINENRINYIDTKSQVYTTLYEKLDDYMRTHFSPEKRRSVYFHHIIHWLRLMPYKIEKNGIRSALFYAGLLKVLDDVAKKYGDAVK